MKLILFFVVLFTTTAHSQFDTTITKDEYAELVYQLKQSRIANNLLKEKIVEMSWLIESGEILTSVYRERLYALEQMMGYTEKRKRRTNKKQK